METEIAVVAPAQSSPNDDADAKRESEDVVLGEVHVHIMVSTRPPLIERQQLNGFLRVERPGRATGEFDDQDDDATGFDRHVSPALHHGAEMETEELRGLRGTFVWLLVRMQAQKMLHHRLRHSRVQYQVSPATESYLLPIEHTNVRILLLLLCV